MSLIAAHLNAGVILVVYNPFPPFSPSPISLVVSVDVKHHVDLLCVHSLFRRLTLNVIVGCALGIEQDAIRDPNNGFLKHCQGVIDDTTEQPVLYLFGCECLQSGRKERPESDCVPGVRVSLVLRFYIYCLSVTSVRSFE